MSGITRTFEIVELLARRAPLGVREIARELNLPLGSTHRILTDLDAEHIAERNPDGEWELSYRLLQISSAHLDRLSLPQLARPHLERLASETQETAFLGVPSNNEIVNLDKVESSVSDTGMHFRIRVELGTRRPMYSTGLGKAVLAFWPDAQLEQYLAEGPFRRYTPHTITEPSELRLELQRIRERGYATDYEETILGMQCIAAPVFNHAAQPVAAISIVGIGPIVDEVRFPDLVQNVKNVAAGLSRQLGMPSENGAKEPALST